jgi:hypothetical protein
MPAVTTARVWGAGPDGQHQSGERHQRSEWPVSTPVPIAVKIVVGSANRATSNPRKSGCSNVLSRVSSSRIGSRCPADVSSSYWACA